MDIYESRPWVGGKVASFKDKDGNHIEMGLHVFFGCYFNLFRLMAKCGVLENLLLKDHTHTFVNAGIANRCLADRGHLRERALDRQWTSRMLVLCHSPALPVRLPCSQLRSRNDGPVCLRTVQVVMCVS